MTSTRSAMPGSPKQITDVEYARIKDSVRRLLKVDLDFYKSNQVMRRLSGYIERSKSVTVDEFCARLITDTELRNSLKDFLTINVTEFFRDTNQFGSLERDVIPEIIRQSATPRIWSAGCSRGAEAYSVAIVLDEQKPGLKYRMVGTDLDRNVVEQARAGGPFSDADVKGVSAARLHKHFLRTPAGYFVKPEMRAKIEFLEGDLLKDRFEQGFDLVMCRNVVIYFSDDAKAMLNRKFVASLRSGGIMFIGGTETIFDSRSMGLDRIHTSFYRKANHLPQALAA